MSFYLMCVVQALNLALGHSVAVERLQKVPETAVFPDCVRDFDIENGLVSLPCISGSWNFVLENKAVNISLKCVENVSTGVILYQVLSFEKMPIQNGFVG